MKQRYTWVIAIIVLFSVLQSANAAPRLMEEHIDGFPERVGGSDTNVPMMGFSIINEGVSAETLSQVAITAGSGTSVSDITSVTIRKDDGDGVFNATSDSSVGGTAFTTSPVNVSLSETIPANSATTYWVSVDLAGASLGSRVDVNIASLGAISLTGSPTSDDSFPYQDGGVMVGSTYYVSPTGNNGNTGTLTSPKAITFASTAPAGSQIVCLSGTYAITSPLSVTSTVEIMGYRSWSDKVVEREGLPVTTLDVSGSGEIQLNNNSSIEELIITGSGSVSCVVAQGNPSNIRECKITGGDRGIAVTAAGANTYVERCLISGCAVAGVDVASGANNVSIKNTVLTGNLDGIHSAESSLGQVAYTAFYSNSQYAINFDSTGSITTYEYNLFYNNTSGNNMIGNGTDAITSSPLFQTGGYRPSYLSPLRKDYSGGGSYDIGCYEFDLEYMILTPSRIPAGTQQNVMAIIYCEANDFPTASPVFRINGSVITGVTYVGPLGKEPNAYQYLIPILPQSGGTSPALTVDLPPAGSISAVTINNEEPLFVDASMPSAQPFPLSIGGLAVAGSPVVTDYRMFALPFQRSEPLLAAMESFFGIVYDKTKYRVVIYDNDSTTPGYKELDVLTIAEDALIRPMQGFWLISRDEVLTPSSDGIAFNNSKPLVSFGWPTGWNMFGVPFSASTVKVEIEGPDALVTLGDGMFTSSIWKYENGGYATVSPAALVPGEAYWFENKSDAYATLIFYP